MLGGNTEALYYVQFPDGHVLAKWREDDWYTVVDPSSVSDGGWRFGFTEKEINDEDPRFFRFAK